MRCINSYSNRSNKEKLFFKANSVISSIELYTNRTTDPGCIKKPKPFHRDLVPAVISKVQNRLILPLWKRRGSILIYFCNEIVGFRIGNTYLVKVPSSEYFS